MTQLVYSLEDFDVQSRSPSSRVHSQSPPLGRCSPSKWDTLRVAVKKGPQGAHGLRCPRLQHYLPLSPPPLRGILWGAGALPARTSVLSKMLLLWAVLDMDTLLDMSSLPSGGGGSFLGMTSFSSSSLGSVGAWLPGPALSGMWLSKGTWVGTGEEKGSVWFGERPRTGDRDI